MDTQPSKNGSKPHYDTETVRQTAQRHWPEIISRLGGIPADHLDGRHHGCPMCGQGKDSFRFIDESAGAIFCNKCFSQNNGDGFAALMKITGKPFPEVLADVAEFCGVQPSQRKNGRATGHEKKNPFDGVKWPDEQLIYQIDSIVKEWCRLKPPITAEAVQAYGGMRCSWGGRRCLGFAGRNTTGEKRALLLYRGDGEKFPRLKSLQERKTHLVRGSTESWMIPTTGIKAASTILKGEGMTDTLTFYSVGLPEGYAAITNACGAKSANPSKLDFSWCKDKHIIVAADADRPGLEGGQRFAVAFFRAGAASVKIVTPPGYEVTEDHGRDFRDWLAEGHTMAELLEHVDATEAVTAEQVEEWKNKAKAINEDARPKITVGIDETRVVDEGIAALGNSPALFQRGGALVHIVPDVQPPKGITRKISPPSIVPVKWARLEELLSSAALWLQWKNEEETKMVRPPSWVVKAIDARGTWPGIRPIEGVVEAPALRADGSVLQIPGYDSETGLLFEPKCEFPAIPNRLTRDHAIRAVRSLMEVVQDFPFTSPEHRAAWLSCVLTPVSRYSYHGPAPFHLVDANAAGSGKSLLTDVTAMIVAGRDMARMSNPSNDDECRKRILPIALAAEPLVLIDNIAGEFGSASLDAALTRQDSNL